jgi:hypothetical protein
LGLSYRQRNAFYLLDEGDRLATPTTVAQKPHNLNSVTTPKMFWTKKLETAGGV